MLVLELQTRALHLQAGCTSKPVTPPLLLAPQFSLPSLYQKVFQAPLFLLGPPTRISSNSIINHCPSNYLRPSWGHKGISSPSLSVQPPPNLSEAWQPTQRSKVTSARKMLCGSLPHSRVSSWLWPECGSRRRLGGSPG